MNAHRYEYLVNVLSKSRIYQDYARAFGEATGLPLALRPVEVWQLPHHGQKTENRFCALLAQKSPTCAVCLQLLEKLHASATREANSMTCAYGLTETAVPVRLGEEVVAYLETGQVLRHKPTQEQFERVGRFIEERAPELDRQQMRAAWLRSPFRSPKKWECVQDLLRIFAEQLSMLSNQIAMQAQRREPLVIAHAKDFLENNYTQDLSLGVVARAVHTSTFYFCKLFKRVTGLNFTDYLSRLRIEKAKNLLLNPNLRVSEIAFEVGFQSLTHFNRVFKRIIGQSPTAYRRHLPAA
jgi:AraC-like DNA-binding protein/ligand-binding sensor protein